MKTKDKSIGNLKQDRENPVMPERWLAAHVLHRAWKDALVNKKMYCDRSRCLLDAKSWLMGDDYYCCSAIWWAEEFDLMPMLEQFRNDFK